MKSSFKRSTTDKQLWGVCGGLGELLGVPAQSIRIAAVLLTLLSSAPVLVIYLVLGFVVPEGPTTDAEDPIDVDWQADGLRVGWTRGTLPASISWPTWAVLMTGLVALGTGLAAVFLLTTGSVGGLEALSPLPEMWRYAISAVAMLTLLGLMPRPYSVTVSHAAVWIERPLRKTMRIPLDRVERVYTTAAGFTIDLSDGTRYVMPLPHDPTAIEHLQEQLAQSRRRALDHKVDLEAAEDSRRELERLANSSLAREG